MGDLSLEWGHFAQSWGTLAVQEQVLEVQFPFLPYAMDH